jgi:hypothetical protein
MSKTEVFLDRTKLESYAWPGAYPLYYLADADLATCCVKCAKDVKEWPSTLIISSEVNWEDSNLYCEFCNERIESAYAEDEVKK